MKKAFLFLFLITLIFQSQGQNAEDSKLIYLAKTYKDLMFRNEADAKTITAIKADMPASLAFTADFISQSVTTKNELIKTDKYLKRPSNEDLKYIYEVSELNQHMREESGVSNEAYLDSLKLKQVSTYELLDNYYSMLFTSVGNKNQPFNLSKLDLKMDSYQLKDDTEKGILFLNCFSYCGTTIWGYMNIPKPANTKKAYANIKKFPTVNGRPYYQYSDFNFPDFEMVIDREKGPESYKGYYINKYYETLIYHVLCMNKEGGSKKDMEDLLLGSILRERSLYKYTKYKKDLEEAFKMQDKD